MFTRRSYLKLSAATVVGAPLAALGTMGQSRAQEPATVVSEGITRGALGNMKAALGNVQAQHNLKYDQKTFSDSTAITLALGQRELDVGVISGQHLTRAIDQGIDIKMICGWGGGYNVLAANNDFALNRDDLDGFKELVDSTKGTAKKLKIGTATGSQQHLKLVYFLHGLGINPDRDVDIVNISFQDHVRALDGKQVDMVMTLSPFASLAAVNKAGKIFYHVYGPGYGRWEIGFATTGDMVLNKPELVQKIVDSHVAAMKTFMDDLPKRLELERQQSSFPAAAMELDQSNFVKLSYNITLADIQRSAKEMNQIGWMKKDLSEEVPKFIDYRFLEKATGNERDKLTSF